MVLKRVFLRLCGLLRLSRCLDFSGFTMSGKSSLTKDVQITSISVDKSARRMYLLSENKIIRSYRIGLGFTPNGHKSLKGDGKTPEGLYYIDRKNPNSKFYMSLGISYPNAQDRAYAQSMGASAGGDIFIHGQNKKPRFWKRDWTEGCIAVKDHEIQEIFALVPIGTPILITP